MKRIALVQQKGGGAKTTLCVHLAVAAHQDGRKTAIIDIDPQASASPYGAARVALSHRRWHRLSRLSCAKPLRPLRPMATKWCLSIRRLTRRRRLRWSLATLT